METQLQTLVSRLPSLAVCSADLQTAFDLLRDCFAAGGKLLVGGNGGSAADSQHIVGEMMKGFLLPRPIPDQQRSALRSLAKEDLGAVLQGALPAIALGGDLALATAVANDNRGDMVFAQQVYGLGRKEDVLWGISTSGNSRNLVNAFHVAQVKGIPTFALTGQGGGKLATLANVSIRVPATTVVAIQELHLPVYHALCAALEEHFFTRPNP